MDLDLIDLLHTTRRQLRQVLAEIGFTELEFPSGPLAVGNEPVSKIDEIHLETGILRLLSPTDCVKDRLAAFYHWNDRQCLQQALWVALEHGVDWNEIDRWSRREGAVEKLEVFRKMIENERADGDRPPE
jgi:hypothetical protein